MHMSGLTEIKAAIEKLPSGQRTKLARWFHQWEKDEWDRQMSHDSLAGKFDQLSRQAMKEHRQGL